MVEKELQEMSLLLLTHQRIKSVSILQRVGKELL